MLIDFILEENHVIKRRRCMKIPFRNKQLQARLMKGGRRKLFDGI